jgi:hypothetical protein
MEHRAMIPCGLNRIVVIFLLLDFSGGCVAQPNTQTVDGPEAKNLTQGLSGYIITNDTGHLTAISIPNSETHIVRKLPRDAMGYGPNVHALSGPDKNGRIAYIENYFFVANEKDQRHLLKTVHVSGDKDETLFSRPGDAMWALSAAGNGEMGSHLALAPSGGNVAFLSQLKSKQMPQALLSVGNIEIWNLNDKVGVDSKVEAIDEAMSWFPDGKRLAYTALVPRKEISNDAKGLDYFGNYFGEKWDEVPCIHIYDIATQASTFFHVGWRPVVSLDGEMMFVGGWGRKDYAWRRVNIKTRESEGLNLPGLAGDIVGVGLGERILYVGLPTTGAKIEYTKNNSPLRGPKLVLTIKITDGKGKKFQTVMPAIDPRSNASFGSVTTDKLNDQE